MDIRKPKSLTAVEELESMDTGRIESHVLTIASHSAEQFLTAISPRSVYLEGGLDRFSHFFVFRGHADDRWDLVPRALRNSD